MNKPIQYDYTMQGTNFSIPVSIQMCNFSMNAALFRRLACRPAAFSSLSWVVAPFLILDKKDR
jgi:hypothetical protein